MPPIPDEALGSCDMKSDLYVCYWFEIKQDKQLRDNYYP